MELSKIYRTVIILFFSLLTVSTAFSQLDEKEENKFEPNTYDLPYNALTTTPYTLPKGALVYQNLDLMFNTLSYGVNDRLSVSAGFSLFNGDLNVGNIAMTQIKYNFYRDEKYAISISNLNFYNFQKVYDHRIDLEQTKMGIAPIFFLNASIKTKAHAFWTFGIGTYHVDDKARPIFTLGYQNRFSKKIAFIADIWLPIVGLERSAWVLPIPAAGFRIYTKSGATFDLGIPFVGMKIPLIKSKKSKVN